MGGRGATLLQRIGDATVDNDGAVEHDTGNFGDDCVENTELRNDATEFSTT